jgi:hypothetical protein
MEAPSIIASRTGFMAHLGMLTARLVATRGLLRGYLVVGLTKSAISRP